MDEDLEVTYFGEANKVCIWCKMLIVVLKSDFLSYFYFFIFILEIKIVIQNMIGQWILKIWTLLLCFF